MQTFAEIRDEYAKKHLETLEILDKIVDVYNKGKELVSKYEQWGMGWGVLNYYPGEKAVYVTLVCSKGRHPLKEANILINECLDFDDQYQEEEVRRYPEDRNVNFKFVRGEFYLFMSVVLLEGPGCRQVGTGEYREVKVWRCV
jgi:hypothetical protein